MPITRVQVNGAESNFPSSTSPATKSVNGLDFMSLASQGRTSYLASVSKFGFFTNSANATWPIGVLLVSWTQGI